MESCRCKRKTETSHLCHWAVDGQNPYTCDAEGTERFVPKPNAVLPGMQIKMAGYISNACDEHWQEFLTSHPAIKHHLEMVLGSSIDTPNKS